MGMPITIDLRDDNVATEVVSDVFAWLRHVDGVFSTYKPASDISRINAGEITISEAAGEVAIVLDRCEDLRHRTRGYFDIRAAIRPELRAGPERDLIDPSGLVKGWSVDRAAARLDAAGARNYAINAGGDIRVRGAALPDTHWRVGIQHPLLTDQVAAVVTTDDDLAIATSGTYERGDHIHNPHTGAPPSGVLSVTIIGADLATADALATAAFAMGADGPTWTASLTDYGAMTILANNTVLSTDLFDQLQRPAP